MKLCLKCQSLASPVLSLLLCSAFLFCHFGSSQAQPTTDPSEAGIVNSIFQQWGISAAPNTWNRSGEICSGTAVDSTTVDDQNINPALKCDCNFLNRTICRITGLKVNALDAQGVIPDEIGNLTLLTHLLLPQNFLRGPLPASIGNLTRMQWMTFGINGLSGTLPKELGNLQNLIMLGFGSNNFSGPLPSELGNLRSLQQLYIDSAGVSGEIPPSFSNLRSLQTVWASDNQFTGKIPGFIGGWRNLTVLRFEGNSFEGPIPSSFANLSSMTDLRVSDISNGSSSSLDFVRNMKSLSILILRNTRISGTIPSNIGDYQSLLHLDLSFNNLTGQIPSSLFNITSLAYLFLGNNSLSGTLPAEKRPQLLTIDLSYNELSGNLPSWVTGEALDLNLIANNFIDRSNNSLRFGLDCLQRNFPCNRFSPRYSSFSVKSGGRSMSSTRGTNFEADTDRLGPATYYVTDPIKWAVSNTGRFMENQNSSYIKTTLSQFTNTLDSELFQTARVSPGSLRYYGLGLQNGNYSVNLQFAEIQIENGNTWKSFGRRVFDVYIQGDRVLKDFDIREKANGISLRAITETFMANVTSNYLEIHLHWAGKGTCCIPVQGTYGPSISAISVTPNFRATVTNEPAGKKNNTGLIVGIAVGVGVLCFICVLAFFLWRRRVGSNIDKDDELIGLSSRANTFSYAELRTATGDFNPANKLGEGGFGPVYKGTLQDGRAVAVKNLSVASHQGKSQFVAEIATISAVQHRNLVKLYGCCIEGDKRLLVYEYLENRSLDQALFGKSSLCLDWQTRNDICLGTARGLAYLHEESRLRIVHRDVKASNILLDEDLNPKISDFGLAKLYDDKKTHISTRVAGTIGYLAPEYAMRGHLTEKADVFGFGVVALEILSGRMNADTTLEQEKVYLLEWAWYLHENNRELELVDQTLSEFNQDEALRLVGVALLCTQASPMLRPSMSRVVAMLSGDIEVGSVTTRPGYLTDWQFGDITSSFMSSDDTSGVSTGGTTTDSQGNQYSNVSPVVHLDQNRSPLPSQPMLHEIIGQGR